MRHYERDGTIKVTCDDCGDTHGTFDNRNSQYRCGECGRFCDKREDYCAVHDLDYSNLTGYDHCPRCRQEENRRAQIRHQATKDPLVEPW